MLPAGPVVTAVKVSGRVFFVSLLSSSSSSLNRVFLIIVTLIKCFPDKNETSVLYRQPEPFLPTVGSFCWSIWTASSRNPHCLEEWKTDARRSVAKLNTHVAQVLDAGTTTNSAVLGLEEGTVSPTAST